MIEAVTNGAMGEVGPVPMAMGSTGAMGGPTIEQTLAHASALATGLPLGARTSGGSSQNPRAKPKAKVKAQTPLGDAEKAKSCRLSNQQPLPLLFVSKGVHFHKRRPRAALSFPNPEAQHSFQEICD